MRNRDRTLGMALKNTISALQKIDEIRSENLTDYCFAHSSFDRGVLKNLQKLYDKQKRIRGLPKTQLIVLLNQFVNFFNLLKLKDLEAGIGLYTVYYIPGFNSLDKEELRILGFPTQVIMLINSMSKKKFPSYNLYGFVKYIDRKIEDRGLSPLTDEQMSTLLDYIAAKIANSEVPGIPDILPDIDPITLKNHFLETCIEYLDKEDWRNNWVGSAPEKNAFIHGDGSKTATTTDINPRFKDDVELSMKAAVDYWENRREKRLFNPRWDYIKYDSEEKNWYIYLPPYIFRYLYPRRDPAYKKTVSMRGMSKVKVATFPKENEIMPANISNYLGWLILNNQLTF